MYQDKTLICEDCGREFVFTTGEQEFYSEKGFANEPKRCPDCRKNKKATRNAERGERQFFEVPCANCGQMARVPFKPQEGGRKVYCSDCFELFKQGQI